MCKKDKKNGYVNNNVGSRELLQEATSNKVIGYSTAEWIQIATIYSE
jgi:hypothetical protein